MTKCTEHFYFSKGSSCGNNWLKNVGHFFERNSTARSRISYSPNNTECAVANKKIYWQTINDEYLERKRSISTSRFIFNWICCRWCSCSCRIRWWCTWWRVRRCTGIVYIVMLLLIFCCAMGHWNLIEENNQQCYSMFKRYKPLLVVFCRLLVRFFFLFEQHICQCYCYSRNTTQKKSYICQSNNRHRKSRKERRKKHMAYHDGRTNGQKEMDDRSDRLFVQFDREKEKEKERGKNVCVYVYMTSNRLIALRRREIGQISGSSRLRTEWKFVLTKL